MRSVSWARAGLVISQPVSGVCCPGGLLETTAQMKLTSWSCRVSHESSHDMLRRPYYRMAGSGPCRLPPFLPVQIPRKTALSLRARVFSWARQSQKGVACFSVDQPCRLTSVACAAIATLLRTGCTVKPRSTSTPHGRGLDYSSVVVPRPVNGTRSSVAITMGDLECDRRALVPRAVKGSAARVLGSPSRAVHGVIPQRHPGWDNLADLADLAALANACFRQANRGPCWAARRHALLARPESAPWAQALDIFFSALDWAAGGLNCHFSAPIKLDANKLEHNKNVHA